MVVYNAQKDTPMPISCAFFWAAAEAISAARRLRTGSERVAESEDDMFTDVGFLVSDLDAIKLERDIKNHDDM